MKTITQKLSLLCLVCIALSCSSDEETNQIPNNFEITATSDVKGLGITLNWEEATDPNGDTVRYDVMLGTEVLAENLTTRTFSFSATAYNTAQNGSVIAKDGNGGERSVSFTVTSSSIVDIPDTNFEQALVNFGSDSDGMLNGQITLQDALAVTNLSMNSAGINSLSGIEAFTNLEFLSLYDNNLTALDISANINLKELYCSANNITEIDLSHHVNLINLECGSNSISTLDVSNNTSLINLECGSNSITTLDISNNTSLKVLEVTENNLTTLEVSNNTNLTYIGCTDNNIKALNVSNLAHLNLLFCDGNNLETLNIKNGNNINFIGFDARSNPNLNTVCVDAIPVPMVIENRVDTGVSFTTTCQ